MHLIQIFFSLEIQTDLLKGFTTNGFAIVPNIIDRKRISLVMENIYKLYCKFSNDELSFSGIEKPWNTNLFHEKLIEFRKNDPELFGAIYDSLKTSLPVMGVVTEDKITRYAAEFLKTSVSDLAISEPMCRLDVPNDKRNNLGWHQEQSYFPQNRNGLNGLVCWIPLVDITEEMGAIHITPKSFLEGAIKLHGDNDTKKDSLKSTQINVPEKLVEKYDDVVVPVNEGDVVFFNMLMFHRSGKNLSSKIRFAIQSRIHIATADDFCPFELINYYNPFVKQKLIEKNYDCSDIPDNERKPVSAMAKSKTNTN